VKGDIVLENNMILEHIEKISKPLNDSTTMDSLIEDIGDAQYVLLGEATHGTSEFYSIRAEITKRLIEEKGFSFIAVEGDWPSCYQLNRYIKNTSKKSEGIQETLLKEFGRWPTWMWANKETASLLEWVKKHNMKQKEEGQETQVGFYGLDVYSLWESMDKIITYLENEGPEAVEVAKNSFRCLQPYGREGQNYGMVAAFVPQTCEDEVVELLKNMQSRRKNSKENNEEAFSAELNALVTVNAERYYRSMVKGGPESWNIRDEHMVEVLERVIQFHGNETKVVVWEHNTHIGDARATDMADEGMVNVGQLLREKYDKRVYAVGFGTHRGTVIAAESWGAPIERMIVPHAQKGSWEDYLHRYGSYDQLVIFDQDKENSILQKPIDHRAIGVVYNPSYEQWGNYVPTVLPKRYDAFIYVDETKALEPLALEPALV
jgi:erythromycin esterase-like protein